MAQKLWFKAKTYGYGWVPCTWQGWLVTVCYLIATFATFFAIDAHSYSINNTLLWFVPLCIFYTVLFMVTCIVTGEEAKWRWGRKDH